MPVMPRNNIVHPIKQILGGENCSHIIKYSQIGARCMFVVGCVSLITPQPFNYHDSTDTLLVLTCINL